MARYDELYWNCNEANSDEVRWAELLIQGKVVPSNIFNTSEWLEDCIARLESSGAHLPMLEYKEIDDDFDLSNRPPEPPHSLMRGWRGIDALELLKATALKAGVYRIEHGELWDDPLFNQSPLEAFLRSIRMGHYPPPELLLSVAKSIDLYFVAYGKLTLEDVFFGSNEAKRKGKYSARSIKLFKGVSFIDFHDSVNRELGFSEASGQPIQSLDQLGLRFLTNYIGEEGHESLCDDDLESFLRGYRRWKSLVDR
jgi:hypothetical protein